MFLSKADNQKVKKLICRKKNNGVKPELFEVIFSIEVLTARMQDGFNLHDTQLETLF